MRHKYPLNPEILREYDIRGVFGRTLRLSDAYAIGRAFGSELDQGARVCVGYDGRLSSPPLEDGVVCGLVESGIEVRRVGLATTPLLAFATHHLQAAGGIMITGSHNPPEDNGFKLLRHGRGLSGEEIRALAARAGRGDFRGGQGGVARQLVLGDYAARLLRDWRGQRPLSVIWDPGHGTVASVLPALLGRLPGRHVVLNGRVDGHFPSHPPDPAEERNLHQLKDAVLAEQADLGLAFDGDGDRLGVVDDQGRVVWSDQLLAIFAEDVLSRSPGAAVVADVKASGVLFDEIIRCGGRPVMARSGRTLIQERMLETGAVLGGEMSGHLFFADRWHGFDDGLYAALRVIEMVSGWPRETLAARVDRLPRRVNTPEMRLPCPEARKFLVVEEVRDRLAAAGALVDTTDGVRVNTADGWWLLRASNTQAALTARCESLSPEGLRRLRRQLAEQLAASGMSGMAQT